ncbi:MAG: DUF503 domain-containing protein [Acidimicrobiales bacterium]
MHVLALRVELHLPGVRSLKEKRSLLRPLLDGGRNRFPVSMAEVGHQDSHKRAAIGVSVVSGSATKAAEVIDGVERFVWTLPDIEVVSAGREWMDMDGLGG